jgi:hypothetical protein
MNRTLAIFLITLASVAATSAKAQEPDLKANIPFDFMVGNTLMPAGEYTITSPFQEVLELRTAGHIATVVSSESNVESKLGSELVFARYGDQYFLHEVLCPQVASLNLEVARSKAEKNARQHATEAQLRNSGEQTMIAAR